jgi:nucleoside-diphosphate-sugar epimerase
VISGLVGHTGFVGRNLAAQRRYDETYHRPDIAAIAGRRFGTLVISAAPGEKWRANAWPEADAAAIDNLIAHLATTRAEHAILVSTVDVYPDPRGVDEDSAVEPADHDRAYGRNRLRLERFVQHHFDRSLVVRLPGLFGPGLKKNLIFDLVQGRAEEFCHRDSTFQFYDLERLTMDVDTARAAGLGVVNLATAPIAAGDLAADVFGRELTRTDVARVDYDMRTRHAAAFDASPPYVLDRVEILDRLRTFAGVAA